MNHCVRAPSLMRMRKHNSKETHALDIVWSSIPFPIDHSIYDSSRSQTGIHKSSLMSKTDSKTDCESCPHPPSSEMDEQQNKSV